MLKRLIDRRRDEEGFTLIELMVVVLIIGILVAIALPTFLGARERAQNKAAQSSVRNALAAAKTIFTDTDDYGSVSVTSLDATEPSLTYTAGASAAATTVSFDVATTVTTDDTIELAAEAATGRCFVLSDEAADVGTRYGELTGGCTADASTPQTGTTFPG